MTLEAVSGAGPLIPLAEINALDLLGVFDTLLIPSTVYSEVEAGGVLDGMADLSYDRVEPEDTIQSKSLEGERAAIAVARQRSVVLLTDDLAARETAAEATVDVHGSIGVIALGYARGRIDREDAASLMRTLQRETSLFVMDAVVERGIQLLDEE